MTYKKKQFKKKYAEEKKEYSQYKAASELSIELTFFNENTQRKTTILIHQ
jgi:hypothetical protein